MIAESVCRISVENAYRTIAESVCRISVENAYRTIAENVLRDKSGEGYVGEQEKRQAV